MNDEWRRVVRTVVQTIVTLIPVVPVLVPALGLSVTTGIGAAALVVAAAITRVMQIPQVAVILNKYLKIPLP